MSGNSQEEKEHEDHHELVSLSPVTHPPNHTHPANIPCRTVHLCAYPHGPAFIIFKLSMCMQRCYHPFPVNC